MKKFNRFLSLVIIVAGTLACGEYFITEGREVDIYLIICIVAVTVEIGSLIREVKED